MRARFDVEDVMQEAFLLAIHGLRRFEYRETADLVAWFAKIAQNHFVSLVAQNLAQIRDVYQERPFVRVDQGSATTRIQLPADETSVWQRVSRLERERLVDEALDHLSGRHREVIVLRMYEGGSWRYVAEKMGYGTPDAPQELYRRAKARLKRVVESLLAQRRNGGAS